MANSPFEEFVNGNKAFADLERWPAGVKPLEDRFATSAVSAVGRLPLPPLSQHNTAGAGIVLTYVLPGPETDYVSYLAVYLAANRAKVDLPGNLSSIKSVSLNCNDLPGLIRECEQEITYNMLSRPDSKLQSNCAGQIFAKTYTFTDASQPFKRKLDMLVHYLQQRYAF